MKDLKGLKKIADGFENTPGMPVLFIGHGSPMNAIEDNEFTKGFRQVAGKLPPPRAIPCIMAPGRS